MRIGLSIFAEPGKSGEVAQQLARDAFAAERAGFSTIWAAQTPSGWDAFTTLTVMGLATTHIELGTAVVPIQGRHPVVMAQQALSLQAAVEGRLALGLGVSHAWIVTDLLGLPYEQPVAHLRDYLDVLDAALTPGPVHVQNSRFTVHNPLDIAAALPTSVLVAALGPVMLRLAGERASGTILWMADERAIVKHVAPRITRAASEAGRPAPRIVAGMPVAVCERGQVDEARAAARARWGFAENAPAYQQLLTHGDAADISDVLIAGDEEAILRKLHSLRDAGVTDVNVSVLPLGSTPDTHRTSKQRTLETLASIAAEL